MTTSYYKVSGVITSEESLHIGSGSRTGVIKHSLPYIPGSVIRGSWGTAFVKGVCKLEKPLVDHSGCSYIDDCLYAKVFEEEGQKSSNIFFRYAYPLHLKCGGVYRPAPKTLYECENSQCRKMFDVLRPPDKCDVCGSKVTPYAGFVCDRCLEKERRPIRLERITATAINTALGSAAIIEGEEEATGTLHTIEAIPKGSKFQMEAILHMDLAEHLDVIKAIFVRGIPDEGMGGSRSRGYGKISIKDLQIQEVEIEEVEKRAKEIDTSRFSVQALSPLLLDGVLEAKTLLEGARRAYSWVFHEGKPNLPEAVMETSRLAVEPYSGWSYKEGRRRRIESGFSAGSVFQFKSEGDNELLSQALAALEIYPLGRYKPHGCGQLKVENPR